MPNLWTSFAGRACSIGSVLLKSYISYYAFFHIFNFDFQVFHMVLDCSTLKTEELRIYLAKPFLFSLFFFFFFFFFLFGKILLLNNK